MKNSNKNDWKKLDDEIMEPISDKLTDLFEYLTPERKERKEVNRQPSSEEDSDEYMEELRRKRRARYEAIKKKYEE